MKENEQSFMYKCKKGNEGVNRDLFHIRAWFIKKHLKKTFQAQIPEILRNFEPALSNVFLNEKACHP